MRIIILRGGALGDFIVTLPALRLLRERWPGAQIELVGNAKAAELGVLAGYLDAIHPQDEARWAQLYGEAALTKELAEWLERFDWVISFWSDPDGELSRHFRGRAERFVAMPHSGMITARPAAAHFCDALAPLGLRTTNFSTVLQYPAEVHAEAARRIGTLRDFIAVHPGSGSPRKNWPVDRWTQLLAELNRPVFLISGEAESDLPLFAGAQPLVLAKNWPLPILGAALARCSGFIGHDTGISHLAAISGASCLLLFGPTDPAIWAPPGPRVRILKNNGAMDSLTVTEVREAWREGARLT